MLWFSSKSGKKINTLENAFLVGAITKEEFLLIKKNRAEKEYLECLNKNKKIRPTARVPRPRT